MKVKATITAIILLAGYSVGEVDRFTPGNLIAWLLNIVGFNLIDSSTALPDFIDLIFILGIGYLIYRRIK
jgi:hypothetical protein